MPSRYHDRNPSMFLETWIHPPIPGLDTALRLFTLVNVFEPNFVTRPDFCLEKVSLLHDPLERSPLRTTAPTPAPRQFHDVNHRKFSTLVNFLTLKGSH